MSDPRLAQVIAILLMLNDNFTEGDIYNALKEAGLEHYQAAYLMMLGYVKRTGVIVRRVPSVRGRKVQYVAYAVSDRGKELLK